MRADGEVVYRRPYRRWSAVGLAFSPQQIAGYESLVRKVVDE